MSNPNTAPEDIAPERENPANPTQPALGIGGKHVNAMTGYEQSVHYAAEAALTAINARGGCAGAEVLVVTRTPAVYSEGHGAIMIAWTTSMPEAAAMFAAANKAIMAVAADAFEQPF